MPLATSVSGDLIPLEDCYILVPVEGLAAGQNYRLIQFFALPDISDSKSAAYNDEPIMGRSFPLKTYSHSENRVISMQIHMYHRKDEDAQRNLADYRLLQSVLYPRSHYNAPYAPPPPCKLRCGELLGAGEICAVLKSCSAKFPTDVPWNENFYTPWKFDIDTTWEVVYRSSNLPGQQRIMDFGA